jgi:rubrerythrin
MISEHTPGVALELLAANLKAISDLYRIYARKFRKYAGVWFVLAGEEKVHSGWIRQLAREVKEGSINIEEGRFNREAIMNVGRYVQSELAKTENEELTIAYALSIALNIEQALAEAKYFTSRETDSEDLKHLLYNLQSANKRHIKRVNELKAERRK